MGGKKGFSSAGSGSSLIRFFSAALEESTGGEAADEGFPPWRDARRCCSLSMRSRLRASRSRVWGSSEGVVGVVGVRGVVGAEGPEYDCEGRRRGFWASRSRSRSRSCERSAAGPFGG